MTRLDQDRVPFAEPAPAFFQKLVHGSVPFCRELRPCFQRSIADISAKPPDHDQPVRTACRIGAYLPVQCNLIFPEFSHIAENRDTARITSGEYLQGGLHGNRIRVVAVVNHGHGRRMQNPETPGYCLHGRDPLTDLFKGQSVSQSHRRCRRGVGNIVNPGNRNLQFKASLRGIHPAERSVKAERPDIRSADAAASEFLRRVGYFAAGGQFLRALLLRGDAEKEEAASFHIMDSPQFIIISVKQNMPVLPDMVKDLRLGAKDAVPVLEIFQMAGPDVGDHSRIGPRDLRQPVHVPEMGNPHLQNRDLILLRQPEDGQGQAKVIIEISFCLKRAQFPAEDGGNHLFCAGLADTAGHACDGNAQNVQVEGCRRSEGGLRIPDENPGPEKALRAFLSASAKMLPRLRSKKIVPGKLPLRKHTECAAVIDGGNESVAVRPGADDGREETSLLRFPAVCRYRLYFPAAKIAESAAHSLVCPGRASFFIYLITAVRLQDGQVQSPRRRFSDLPQSHPFHANLRSAAIPHAA